MPRAITTSSINPTRFFATFSAAFLAIGALFAIDTFLARLDESESQAQAGRLFNEGRQLMTDGKNVQAVDRLKEAIAIERDNREYEEALAKALLAAGKPADAQAALTDLLEGDPTDGQSNLMMARVFVREGKIDTAISYYHGAIYGRWKNTARANRLNTRFELIDLLAQQGKKEELLAELLPVEQQAPDDIATRIRIGRLFLETGSYVRASSFFRAVLNEQPKNAGARAGLGEAEFGRGNYRTAANDFVAALRINPADREARAKLEICSQVLALDPTGHGLSASERYERSRRVLELTVNQTINCAANQYSGDLAALVANAQSYLDRPVSPSDQSKGADSWIDLAERLWLATEKSCRKTSENETLSLVLARLAQ